MKLKTTTAILTLFLLAALPALSQNVRGRVTDADGESVAGAVVSVKGGDARHSAVTDLEGNYSIKAGETDVLLFQMLGFKDLEVRVGKRSVIDAVLESDKEMLEEVVVTGYQTISKERATGSFDIIGKAQLEKPAASIANRLLGVAAGLTTYQDAYGNVSGFKIRGTSSFSASSAPLLVVDGFAVSGGFDSINPNDVKSVTVLKDAAAASIWGAKSANGVIVVTTKSGGYSNSGTQVSVDYSGFYRVTAKTDLNYQLSQAISDDVIEYELYAYDHYVNDRPQESTYTGSASKVYELLQERDLGHISAADCNKGIDSYRNLSNREQIEKYFLRNATVHQENVSVDIRSNKASTSLSALYMDTKDGTVGSDSKSYMVNFRSTASLFKWLDLNLNGTYNRFTSASNTTSYYGFSPYELFYDEAGDPIWYSSGYNLNYIARNIPAGTFPYDNWGYNPVEERKYKETSGITNNFRIQGGLKFKILPGLDIESKVQYEGIESYSRSYSKDGAFDLRILLNTTSYLEPGEDKAEMNYPLGGSLSQGRGQNAIFTTRNQVDFNRAFGKHAVALVAGVETIDNVAQSFGYPTTYGYNDNTLEVGIFPNGIPGPSSDEDARLKDWRGNTLENPNYNNSFGYSTDRYFSAFGNASYTFNGKYTVSGSYRTDASNLITDDPKYRYAPFWSVGANWKIGRENFMSSLPWVDDLTVRATIGDNGNVDKSTSFKPLVYTSSSINQYTGDYTGGMSSYGNPTLRWERTRTCNVGVDFSLWNAHLFGKVDWYYKHSFDLIADREIPYLYGTTSVRLNNGEILNKGLEFEIGSRHRMNKDINFGGTLMFSLNHNRVLTLKKQPVLYSSLVMGSPWLEGYDMNTLWCYQYGGMKNVGTKSSPIYEPTILDKDGKKYAFTSSISGMAENFSYNMGTTSAPINTSLLLDAKVYDFDISMIFTGKFGHVFRRESFNYPQVFYSGKCVPNSKYSEIARCNPDEMIPLPQNDLENGLFYWAAFYPYISYLVESASVIRMQELNVTYNFRENITDRLGLGGLSLFAVWSNPFNIYFNSYNEDPEFPKGSIRLRSSFTFGARCKF